MKIKKYIKSVCVCVHFVAQSYLTLCDPMNCSLPGSFVHGDSPGKNAGVGCHALLQEIFALLQGIFLTQGLNPGVLHCRWILYHLSHQRSPGILEYPGRLEPIPSPGDCPNPGSKRSLLHCWWILYRLSYPGAHQGEKHVSKYQLTLQSLL